MNLEKSLPLLLDAPEGRHFCQLHKTPESLAYAVTVFAETGLRRGDAVILVASMSRIDAVLAKLGDDVTEWRKRGQLVIHDSTETLNRFMLGSVPEWNEFLRTITPVLDAAKTTHWRKIRVYGEMVNDLWRAGNPSAAIRLEEYWNRLANDYRFSLFCGYEMDYFDAAVYKTPIAEIARTHTDMSLTEEDDQFNAAVSQASKELLGTALSEGMNRLPSDNAERALGLGRQIILWLQQHMPHVSDAVLERAHMIHRKNTVTIG